MSIVCNDIQSRKVPLPSSVMLSGIEIDVRLEQPSKTEDPKDVIWLGISN